MQAYADRQVGLVYGPGELDGAMTRADFQALTSEQIGRYALIAGHFTFGVHRRVPRPSRYVTVVRDPVDRVASLFYHYRNLPGIRFGGKGHRERLRMRFSRASLEEWVFKGDKLAVDNLMVRNIAGVRGVPFGGITQTMLDQALMNIEAHFAALLVTEQMDRSAAVLGQVIGSTLPTVQRENVNPKRPALDTIEPAARERIRELNRFDAMLHDHARSRLEQAAGPTSAPA